MRHREKWRLALDMIAEMTGPGGWVPDLAARPRRVVAADIAYGDNALFREQLTAAGWQYAVAVKGSVSAHDGNASRWPGPTAGWASRPRPPTRARRPACAPSPSRTRTRSDR